MKAGHECNEELLVDVGDCSCGVGGAAGPIAARMTRMVEVRRWLEEHNMNSSSSSSSLAKDSADSGSDGDADDEGERWRHDSPTGNNTMDVQFWGSASDVVLDLEEHVEVLKLQPGVQLTLQVSVMASCYGHVAVQRMIEYVLVHNWIETY
jgi:hypothetical protein